MVKVMYNDQLVYKVVIGVVFFLISAFILHSYPVSYKQLLLISYSNSDSDSASVIYISISTYIEGLYNPSNQQGFPYIMG